MAREIIVRLLGDSRDVEAAFKRSAKAAQGFQAQVTGVGAVLTRSFAATAAAIGAAGGVRALFRGFGDAVSAASDTAEQMSKTGQVFNESAGEITAWAETTSTAFGISRREALATASSFGALFAPMGLVGVKAAQQSRRLTELGADLASFYNTDVKDALEAIRSGIVGESEPLRRYGVLLSETRVQAQALADTHKQSAKDLTAAEKAAARIAIIFRDTSKASGDFARTSEGLANQSRILHAELDDLSANIGAFYLPGLTKMAAAANDLIAPLLGVHEAAAAGIGTQVALVPKLAREYSIMRERGVSATDAIRILGNTLGNSAQSAELIGDAISYAAGGPQVARIAKLNQEIHNLGTEAEASAKMMHGLAASVAAVAAAQPRGAAALTPGQRNQLAIARAGTTAGTGDNLAALGRQREILAKQIQFITARLKSATGGTARNLARTLADLYRDDAAALNEITSITEAAASAARTAADKAKAARKAAADAAKQAAEAARDERMGWLDFAIERAEATKTLADDRKALRAREKFLKDLIAHEGRSLDLVRELFRTRQAMRDLNKSQADVDPLAGLMQVSTRRLTNMLAAGTGLGVAGRQQLGRNIAGAEIRPVYVGVNIDGREVGRAVTKDQARTGRRTSKQTSGYRS